jgi:hypothetical protein
MRAPLTWSGVREYPQLRVGGRAARILRRPEQILRPGYLRTIERITPTLGHPRDDQGKPVLISAENYRRFAVGSVGDKIEQETIDGYPVPVGNITVVAKDAIEAIQAGNDQVSQGFFALVSPPPLDEKVEIEGTFVGIWKGPNGPEEYDFEHICDPAHPEAIAYAQENPDFPLHKIGANHIAVGIPRGRGLAQAQARPIEAFDDADHAGGVILFLDSPQARETNKMPKQRIKWAAPVPKNFSGVVPCLDQMEVEAEDSPELMEFLTKLSEFLANMVESMAGMEAAAETATGEAVAQEAAATEAQATAVQAQEAVDSLTQERDALLAEVKPLRESALTAAKAKAAALAPTVGLDACETLTAVQRAVVAAKLPALAEASDAVIEGAWAVMSVSDSAPAPAPDAPSPSFMQGGDPAKKTKSRAATLYGAN